MAAGSAQQVVRSDARRGYLAVCQELARSALAYVEPRRGVFVEIHGSHNNVGGVPFMMGYLAFGLVRYCQVTGSEEAADVLCDMADGLIAEREQSPGSFLTARCPSSSTPPSSNPARALLERGLKVIDLSADFRLRDAAVYEEFYGHVHPAPDLLGGGGLRPAGNPGE